MDNQQFDQLFSEGLRNYKPEYRPEDWTAMAAKLDGERRRPFVTMALWPMIGIAASLTLFASLRVPDTTLQTPDGLDVALEVQDMVPVLPVDSSARPNEIPPYWTPSLASDPLPEPLPKQLFPFQEEPVLVAETSVDMAPVDLPLTDVLPLPLPGPADPMMPAVPKVKPLLALAPSVGVRGFVGQLLGRKGHRQEMAAAGEVHIGHSMSVRAEAGMAVQHTPNEVPLIFSSQIRAFAPENASIRRSQYQLFASLGARARPHSGVVQPWYGAGVRRTVLQKERYTWAADPSTSTAAAPDEYTVAFASSSGASLSQTPSDPVNEPTVYVQRSGWQAYAEAGVALRLSGRMSLEASAAFYAGLNVDDVLHQPTRVLGLSLGATVKL